MAYRHRQAKLKTRRSSAFDEKSEEARRELLRQIPDLVSETMREHFNCVQKHAKQRIFEEFDRTDRQLFREERARKACLAAKDWHLAEQFKRRLRRNGLAPSHRIDPAKAALSIIPTISGPGDRMKLKSIEKGVSRSSRMPKVLNPPKYDAWVPVLRNYWSGKELNLEPYMPFLGDQDVDCELSFEVFEDMAGDAGKDLEFSDGEVNKDGKFVLPKIESERELHYSMAKARWREGTRKAILAVTDQFQWFDETMWGFLGTALGINDMRRLKALARVAEERRRDQKKVAAAAMFEREQAAKMEHYENFPVEEEMPRDENESAFTNPLKHFCFTCHVFWCAQHAEADVEPVLPIEDLPAQERERALKFSKAAPCGSECFIHYRNRKLEHGQSLWTAEEVLILREAVPMFGMDPCSLAKVIGSRSCTDVYLKLEDPIEADIAKSEIERALKPRHVEEPKQRASTGEEPDKKATANKTVVERNEDSANDQDFIPCCHSGPCTIEVCTCVQKSLHCETTCGCNFGRYGEGGETGGVVWLPPSKEAVTEGRARECLNRHYGCSCEAGHCNDLFCPCFDQNRACSPDLCECDCTVLPGAISLGKRVCRNGPVNIGKHKRTFVGRSEVHGFGLFAGEKFETDDLVGVYSGQLIDTRLADMIGRIYDVTNRTYIFNVTETLVIDGGLLGSKAKFVNHTKPGATENCASRLVRVRGDAYVGLFCRRAVEPGEEFFFDYRFAGEIPAWAKEEKSARPKK